MNSILQYQKQRVYIGGAAGWGGGLIKMYN